MVLNIRILEKKSGSSPSLITILYLQRIMSGNIQTEGHAHTSSYYGYPQDNVFIWWNEHSN